MKNTMMLNLNSIKNYYNININYLITNKLNKKELRMETYHYEYKLIKLPYALDSLAPYMSKETLEYHYLKHHKSYVDNLNALIKINSVPVVSDDDIYSLIFDYNLSRGPIFNNAAQIFNHNFFFLGLKPNNDNENDNNAPKGEILEKINENFGTFEKLKEEFNKIALGTFGSGWIWLVKNPSGKLEIIATVNADTPIVTKSIPLLTCDVWEHAYYIDYRNSRLNYLNSFWKIVNWDFVLSNLNCEKEWNVGSKRTPNF